MRIGVDFGGTKIEAIAIDANGVERARRRVDTPRGDYAASLEAVAALVAAVEADAGARGSVGVGIPGAVSPATGVIKNANSTWLIGHPLHRDLSRAIGREVRVANDANCFALSEAADGAAAGVGVVFGVILGTGVGGGVVVNGAVLSGANAIAGEWGHNALPWPDAAEWPGPPCYCGRRGCIEVFLCGHGLQMAYGGTDLANARAIADAAAGGHAGAVAALTLYVRRLAKALATVVNLLDPDVIVLGGGLSNIDGLYARVPEEWRRWIFSDRVDTRLVRNRHGDSSGVRGAAWLWPV
ncbi:MAG TPA: ROK family protein [Vicinamibacterales bacterium]|jgi:fructokinase